MANYAEIITKIYNDTLAIKDKGSLATYISELANTDSNKFGVYITTVDDASFGIGDYLESFSIQSIVKVLSLAIAYKLFGEDIWKRVDVEPSGNSFNSLIQLEADNGIPRNPFINAGAIVTSDILLSYLPDTRKYFLDFIRELAGNDDLDYCERIADSEWATGYRNIAICNFLKSFDNIQNDPNEVLDLYFNLCSIEVNCKDLSNIFSLFANEGRMLNKNKQVLTKSQTKRINAIMQTCGFYDQSGDFAFRVGLPGKSGVGGGIVAIHPERYAITTWSPKLNEKGNSYRGMYFLENFTTETEFSIF
ncbi:L-glutaminase [Balneicella halophila]|uniref:Glutaminase n=1 Tax=Balneicella halophila TaxID=1537566 RepID=A0A7L4UQW4_BALHA|nr:glutaminase [Balneicella halophila]PVX50992.1 L-glutaminase [Balneicella halophila]